MYYIGIKQSGFNALNSLSENSAHWLTYFDPDSKLKIQTANHWNSPGVKAFQCVDGAIALMEKVKEYGIDGCFVARIEKDGNRVILEATDLTECRTWYYVSADFWRMVFTLKQWMLIWCKRDAFDGKFQFVFHAGHLHKVNENDINCIRDLLGKYIAWEKDFRANKEQMDNAMHLFDTMDTVLFGDGCKDISPHEHNVTPWPPKD